MILSRKSQFFLAFAFLFLVTSITSTALAQSKRAEKSYFLNARVGLSTYGGDRDEDIGEDFLSLQVSEKLSKASYSLGLEFGYAFSPALSLSIGYQLGNYTEINNNPSNFSTAEAPLIDEDASSKLRHTIPLVLRWMVLPSKRLSPYAHIGANLSFGSIAEVGQSSSTNLAFGPVLGLGLDYVVSPKASLFLEISGYYGFPDDKLDAADPGVEGDETDFDLLGFYGLGLRYSFKSACTPVEAGAINGPNRLAVNESGSFTADAANEATMPVESSWAMGDGTTGSGTTITHSYAQPGTYTVTFTQTNCGGATSSSQIVEVYDPCPDAAEIVTMNLNPTDPIINESITFTANVNGTAPLTYSWNFGDGGTATTPTATHTYDEPGDYTVTLEISNCGGTDTRTLTVPVTEFRCSDIVELNTVFFEQNSSELDDEARALLDENLAKLKACPDILVRLDGYADRGERQVMQLSQARAEAVEQYYIENGISPNRLMARGLGLDPLAGKGVDGRRNRRVDSIVVDSFDQ